MNITIPRRAFLAGLALAGCATSTWSARAAPRVHSSSLLGYTEYRTNLPSRYANQITARACVVNVSGRDRREVAHALVDRPYVWTQFAGWSPDGADAVILRGWEDPANGAWEEQHKTFRMTQGWQLDIYLLHMKTGRTTNLTAFDRVSSYNSGLIFMPDGKLGFTALVNGISHPFLMDRNGHHKKDLTKGSKGFTYGFSASPNGKWIAYHKDYQVYIANADGTNPRHIVTGNPFNFVPQWSPDSAWLMFVSGERENCQPYLVRPDGSDLHKLADRNGYCGWTSVYDVYDFHEGSSDLPVWSIDGKWVYYTAKAGGAIELFRVSLDGKPEQLTHSKSGVAHYHPKPSPDGRWLAFGSNQTGTRQLYVMDIGRWAPHPISHVPKHHGAMWAYWRP